MATNDPAELHARLQTRALVDMAAEQRAAGKKTEDLTREITALRSDIGALRADMAAQHRAGLVSWADRNPWPAAFLVVAILLGLAGQLPILSQLLPLAGNAHATGS